MNLFIVNFILTSHVQSTGHCHCSIFKTPPESNHFSHCISKVLLTRNWILAIFNIRQCWTHSFVAHEGIFSEPFRYTGDNWDSDYFYSQEKVKSWFTFFQSYWSLTTNQTLCKNMLKAHDFQGHLHKHFILKVKTLLGKLRD